MKLGFGAAVWLRDDHLQDFHRMLDDMAMIGYDGIEFYYYAYETFRNQTEKFARLLELHVLELSGYYAKMCFQSPEELASTTAYVKDVYRFARDVGSKNVILDEGVANRLCLPPPPADIEGRIAQMAETANELGRFAQEMGMRLSFHEYWGSFLQNEEYFHKFMEQTDSSLVDFCCDTAQVRLSGWDEVATMRRYAKRMSYVHFKDVTFEGRPHKELWPGYTIPSDSGAYQVDSIGRMVELGRGVIDFPACMQALRDAGFDGWIVGNPACRITLDDCMDSQNNPSAQLEYNIPEMLREIISSRFYESDYKSITQKLLYENISYDYSIEHGIVVVAESDVFEYKR